MSNAPDESYPIAVDGIPCPPLRLTEAERDAALRALPAWTYDPTRNALHRHILFADFTEALDAMVRIGVIAERSDHHPEWTNVYNKLDIWLTTHDTKGISERDVKLASEIDRTIRRM